MSSLECYPEMDRIFSIYFGQDFDLFGEAVPEIVVCYKRDSLYQYKNMVHEIDSFRNEHPHDLDAAFDQIYGGGFSPEPWGYTAALYLTRYSAS